MKSILDIKESVDGFIDEKAGVIYFKEIRDLSDELSEKFDLSRSENRSVRRSIESIFKVNNITQTSSISESKNDDETPSNLGEEEELNKDDTKNKYEYLGISEEEVQELESLLKRSMTDDEMSNLWLVAFYKTIKHYQLLGYDLSTPLKDIEKGINERKLNNIVRKDNTVFTALVRSAKTKLLRLKYTAWVDLGQDDTELAIVTSDSSKDIFIIKNQEGLSNLSDDPWIMSLNGKEKYMELQSLLNGGFELLPEKKYSQFEFLIRLPGNIDYAKIFKSLKSTAAFNEDEIQ